MITKCEHVCTFQPDADYFRVDLPNSGRVILNKSLDFESKTHLQLTLYAVVYITHRKYCVCGSDEIA